MDAIEAAEAELNDTTARAWKLVNSTDGRLFTVRPQPAAWSAAECIAHLSVSSEMFLPALRTAIDDARSQGLTGKKEPTMDLLGRLLRWAMEPPIRKRYKATAPFVPKSVRAKADAFGEFAALQSKLIDLLHDARGLDFTRVKITSPFNKRVRYNMYSAFKIITAHQRRHLWQAENAVAALRERVTPSAPSTPSSSPATTR